MPAPEGGHPLVETSRLEDVADDQLQGDGIAGANVSEVAHRQQDRRVKPIPADTVLEVSHTQLATQMDDYNARMQSAALQRLPRQNAALARSVFRTQLNPQGFYSLGFPTKGHNVADPLSMFAGPSFAGLFDDTRSSRGTADGSRIRTPEQAGLGSSDGSENGRRTRQRAASELHDNSEIGRGDTVLDADVTEPPLDGIDQVSIGLFGCDWLIMTCIVFGSRSASGNAHGRSAALNDDAVERSIGVWCWYRHRPSVFSGPQSTSLVW